MVLHGDRYVRMLLLGYRRQLSSVRAQGLGAMLAVSIGLLILLALGVVSLPVIPNAGPKSSHRVQRFISETKPPNGDVGPRGKQWTEVLSWEPRAFLYHNFLSKEECEHLIELAKHHLSISTVADNKTGRSKNSRVRTSSGMFLRRGQDKTVRAIEKRIAEYSHIPVEHGEGLQVLSYEIGQKYEPHPDYFVDEFNVKNGGQRIATLLMYLSEVEEGGETVFPHAKANSSSLPWYNDLSECGKTGLSVKPKMGDAILFWSMKSNGTVDPRSMHGACPVIKGTKWSSAKWMRVKEYNT